MHRKTLSALVATLAIAGCADVPHADYDAKDRGEIITGSNIPRRSTASKVETVSGEEVRRNRDLPVNDNPAGDGGAKSR